MLLYKSVINFEDEQTGDVILGAIILRMVNLQFQEQIHSYRNFRAYT